MGRPALGSLVLLLACSSLVPDASGGPKVSKIDQALDLVESLVPEVVAGSEEEDPRIRSLRLALAGLTLEQTDAKSRLKARSFNGPRSNSEGGRFPLPGQLSYQFGSRQPLLRSEKNGRLKSILKKGQVPTEEDLAPDSLLEWLSHGCLPETELLLLAIQARLDVQAGGDRLALFLESWRNRGPHGDESFYEALDRTAGTPDEVFFFDAMLGDFVGRFAGQAGKRWNLKLQHDRLQQAFLSYRQYRGLIEAVSYAVVLPPDIDLPARLSRYDYESVGAGLLSLRHQVDLLVESLDGDVIGALDRVQDFLKQQPLPEDLWDAYDPLPELSALIRADLVRLVDRKVLTTEELWQAQADARSRIADAIREACQQRVAH